MKHRLTRYSEVIAELGYLDSENYVTDPQTLPEIAHLLEAAKGAHVRGAYVFRTGPHSDSVLPPPPAVYVAEAASEDEAREIHRRIWNQGAVPYLVVVLPSHVRVYTGFRFDRVGKADELVSAPFADWQSVKLALSSRHWSAARFASVGVA